MDTRRSRLEKKAGRLNEASEKWFKDLWDKDPLCLLETNIVVGRSIADCINQDHKIIIEVDGRTLSYRQKLIDARKDLKYTQLGYEVFRVTAYDRESFDKAKEWVRQILARPKPVILRKENNIAVSRAIAQLRACPTLEYAWLEMRLPEGYEMYVPAGRWILDAVHHTERSALLLESKDFPAKQDAAIAQGLKVIPVRPFDTDFGSSKLSLTNKPDAIKWLFKHALTPNAMPYVRYKNLRVDALDPVAKVAILLKYPNQRRSDQVLRNDKYRVYWVRPYNELDISSVYGGEKL